MQQNSAHKQPVHVPLSILKHPILCLYFQWSQCLFPVYAANTTNTQIQSVSDSVKLRRRLRLHDHLPILEPSNRQRRTRTRWSFGKPLWLGLQRLWRWKTNDACLRCPRCWCRTSTKWKDTFVNGIHWSMWIKNGWMFPKIGVPPNHPFDWKQQPPRFPVKPGLRHFLAKRRSCTASESTPRSCRWWSFGLKKNGLRLN